MPNIMVTSKCNLACSYCFANKLVNQNDASDITLENFQYALDFITSSGRNDVGIIGGEPTLHHDFHTILSMLIDNTKINDAIIFTNGIELEPYIDQILHPKFGVLFNCNTSPNISDRQYEKLVTNIGAYMKHSNHGMLGINIFSDDMDCSYIFELAKQFNQKEIRVSLTVPNLDICTSKTYFEYFADRKEKLLQFIQLAEQFEVKLKFDCDAPPFCEISKERSFMNNIIVTPNHCTQIIDITQNLEAVRCFGTSHLCKVNLKDFPDVQTLCKYFSEQIDQIALQNMPKEECKTCFLNKTRKCRGGCLRFRTKDILEATNE